MTSSSNLNFNAATGHRFIPAFSYTEERPRWSVLQCLDYLGYIPIVAVAIGVARVAGSIFVFLGTVITDIVASYYENQPLKNRCLFIAQRALGELSRGLFQEILSFGFLSLFYDLFRQSYNPYGAPDDTFWARGPVFRIDIQGNIHYPCGSAVENLPRRRQFKFRAPSQPTVGVDPNASYTILGLTSDASINTIKKAYRKLARTHHSDKQCPKRTDEIQEAYDARIAVAKARFQQVSEAYEALKVSRNFS